jgi:hypothetical protein
MTELRVRADYAAYREGTALPFDAVVAEGRAV